MAGDMSAELSRRERQVMEALYRLGQATAADLREALPDAPTSSAVRGALWQLSQKGHVLSARDGRRHVYRPAVAKGRARRSAARRLLDTFFAGSVEQAVASLLGAADRGLSADEAARLRRLIEAARTKGEPS